MPIINNVIIVVFKYRQTRASFQIEGTVAFVNTRLKCAEVVIINALMQCKAGPHQVRHIGLIIVFGEFIL